MSQNANVEGLEIIPVFVDKLCKLVQDKPAENRERCLLKTKTTLACALVAGAGEDLLASSGQRARLVRPLDFLVVSDHAEYLGIADLLDTGNLATIRSKQMGKRSQYP